MVWFSAITRFSPLTFHLPFRFSAWRGSQESSTPLNLTAAHGLLVYVLPEDTCHLGDSGCLSQEESRPRVSASGQWLAIRRYRLERGLEKGEGFWERLQQAEQSQAPVLGEAEVKVTRPGIPDPEQRLPRDLQPISSSNWS